MYITLFLVVIISGVSVLFVKINGQLLKLILSFSGAFLFAISVTHLIPEIYVSATPKIGLYVLLGFFIQLFLEFFSEGIEHGHVHVHEHDKGAFPFTMLLGLCIHSFLEGMPLNHESHHEENTLFLGLLLHKIPVAIALTSMLIQSNISKAVSMFALVVFALITPIGAIVSHAIDVNMVSSIAVYSDKIMAVVVGIFLHISTTILFEASENHRFNLIKFLVILLGAGTAIIM